MKGHPLIVSSAAWMLCGCLPQVGGQTRDLALSNETPWTLKIAVNGRYLPGTIQPHSKRGFENLFRAGAMRFEAIRTADNVIVYDKTFEDESLRRIDNGARLSVRITMADMPKYR